MTTGPTVTGVTDGLGPNLIVNGSFEQGHADLGASRLEHLSTIPGWTYGADQIPFEVQTGGVGDLAAQDGNALVELDGDTTGNGHPGQATPNANHTDATIQQVIAGTVAGEEYELTFYYSPRPGDSANNDSGLRVLWNGVEIDNIDSTNLPSGWTQITLHVIGTGVNDTLAFQGTGSEDELGAFIDNVSLRSVTILDDEDTTLIRPSKFRAARAMTAMESSRQARFCSMRDRRPQVDRGAWRQQPAGNLGRRQGHRTPGNRPVFVDTGRIRRRHAQGLYDRFAELSLRWSVDKTGHYTFTLVAPLDSAGARRRRHSTMVRRLRTRTTLTCVRFHDHRRR